MILPPLVFPGLTLEEVALCAGRNIEIGLEQAPFVFLYIIFSSFERVKSLLIMGFNNTKNSSLKCDFLMITYK